MVYGNPSRSVGTGHSDGMGSNSLSRLHLIVTWAKEETSNTLATLKMLSVISSCLPNERKIMMNPWPNLIKTLGALLGAKLC